VGRAPPAGGSRQVPGAGHTAKLSRAHRPLKGQKSRHARTTSLAHRPARGTLIGGRLAR
jgi:hypothetical protein